MQTTQTASVGIRTYDRIKAKEQLTESQLSSARKETQALAQSNVSNPLMSTAFVPGSEKSSRGLYGATTGTQTIGGISNLTTVHSERTVMKHTNDGSTSSNPLMFKFTPPHNKTNCNLNDMIQNSDRKIFLPNMNPMVQKPKALASELQNHHQVESNQPKNQKRLHPHTLADSEHLHKNPIIHQINFPARPQIDHNDTSLFLHDLLQFNEHETSPHQIQSKGKNYDDQKTQKQGQNQLFQTISNKFHEAFHEKTMNESSMNLVSDFPMIVAPDKYVNTSQSLINTSSGNLDRERKPTQSTLEKKNSGNFSMEKVPVNPYKKKKLEESRPKAYTDSAKSNKPKSLEIESTFSFLNQSKVYSNSQKKQLTKVRQLEVIPLKEPSILGRGITGLSADPNPENDELEESQLIESLDYMNHAGPDAIKPDYDDDDSNVLGQLNDPDERTVSKGMPIIRRRTSKPSAEILDDQSASMNPSEQAQNNDLAYVIESFLALLALIFKGLAVLIRGISNFVDQSVTRKTIKTRLGEKMIVMVRIPGGDVVDMPEASFQKLRFWVISGITVFVILFVLNK